MLNAGEYTVELSGLASTDNYELNFIHSTKQLTVSQKSVTVVAVASDWTYGDEPTLNKQVTGVLDGDAETLAFALKVSRRGGEEVTGALNQRLGAGEYTLTVTHAQSNNYAFDESQATKDFSVAKKELNATITFDGAEQSENKSTLVYGTTPVPQVAYSGFVDDDEQTNKGTVTYTKGEAKTNSAKDVGTYSVNVEWSEGLANYNYVGSPVTLEITKKDIAVTVSLKSEQSNEFTYGDAAQTIKGKFEYNVGQLAYEDTNLIVFGSIDLVIKKDGEDISGNLNAGNYTITAEYANSDIANYNVTVTPASFEIKKAKLTLTVSGHSEELVYGVVPSATVKAEGYKFTDDAQASLVYKQGDVEKDKSKLDAGSYNLAVKWGVDAVLSNYEYEELTETLTVSAKELSLVITASDIMYGTEVNASYELTGFAYEQNKDEVFPGLKLEYYKGDETYTPSHKYFDEGEYTVKLTGVSGNKNYTVPEAQNQKTFKVGKKAVEFSSTENVDRLSGWSFTPTKEKIGDDFTVEGKIELKTTDIGTYNYSSEAEGEQFEWSTPFAIKIDDVDVSSNFDVTFDFSITLDPSTFNFTKPENKNETYDGETHSYPIAIDNVLQEQDRGKITAKIEYSTQAEGEYSDTVPSFKNVGNFSVYYKLTADNYTTEKGSFTVTITKKDLNVTVKVDHAELTYGEKPVVTVDWQGFAGSENKENITGYDNIIYTRKDRASLSGNEYLDAGTYTITLELSNDNYDIHIKSAGLVINKKSFLIEEHVIQHKDVAWSFSPAFTAADAEKFTFKGTLHLNTQDANTYTYNGDAHEHFEWQDGPTVVLKDTETDVTKNFEFEYDVTVTLNEDRYNINKPTLKLTYDGQPHTFAITATLPEDAGEGVEVKVEYGTSAENYDTESAPVYTNQGTYNIYYRISATGYPEVKDVMVATISPDSNVLKGVPGDQTFPYNGKSHTFDTSAIKAKYDVDNITKSYSYTPVNGEEQQLQAEPDYKKAGTYKITVTSTAESEHSNYTAVTKVLTVTIEQIDLTVTAAANNTYTYDKGAHGEGITVSSNLSEELDYTIKYNCVSASITDSSDAPQFTDAATYTVTYTVTENSGNYKVASGEYTVVINRADVTITTDGIISTYTYTGADQTVDLRTAVISEHEGTVEYKASTGEVVEGVFTFKTVESGNNVVLTITVPESTNYNRAEKTITLTVNKAQYLVTAPSEEFTYNGKANGENVKVTLLGSDEATVTYELVEPSSGVSGPVNSVAELQLVNAGSYNIKYSIGGNDNYEDKTDTFTLVINKANYTVTGAEDQKYTYNGSEQGNEIKVSDISGADVTAQVLKITSDGEKTKFKDAKAYTVTYTINADGHDVNYNKVEDGTFTVTIDKFTIDDEKIQKTEQTYTYNGGEQGEGITLNDLPDSEYTITYEYDNGSKNEAYKFTAPDTYTVTYRISGTNYTDKSGSITITISEATLTIPDAPTNVEKEYDGEAYSKKELTVQGAVGDDGNYISITQKVSFNGEDDYKGEIKDAGVYTVTYTLTFAAEHENLANYYTLSGGKTSGTYTITINKVAVTLDTESITKTFTYTGDAQTLDLSGVLIKKGEKTIELATHGGAFTYTVNGESKGAKEFTFTNVKDAHGYRVVISLSDSTNYASAQAEFTITVNQAEYTSELPEVTIDEQLLGKDKTLAQVAIPTDGYTWKNNGNKLVEGSHAYNAVYADPSGNYLDKDTTITFSSRKEKYTVTFAENIEADYTDETVKNYGKFTVTVKDESTNNVDLTTAGITVNRKIDSNYDKIGSTYLLKYTLSYTSEYFTLDKTECTTIFKLKSVEYSGTLYTIEDALNSASSGTVTVKSNTAFATVEAAKKANYYSGEAANSEYYTLKSNTSLDLPYEGTSTYGSPGTDATGTCVLSFGDESKRTLLLTITENIVLTSNGTINVGGYVTGSAGGNFAGQTFDKYAQITLQKNARIESHGNMNVYGFIVEESENNGSKVIAHSGTVKMPFVVVEHRGGSIFMNVGTNGTPFNRFFLHNITSEFTIMSDATLIGDAKLKTDKKSLGFFDIPAQENQADIKLIGSDKNYLLQLESGSKVVAKLQAKAFNKSYAKSPVKLDIYGNMTFNVMSIKIKVAGISVDVSTKGVFFPISWYWNITLKKAEGQESATVNATAQDFKILPGGSLTVDEGVTLQAGKVAVYKESDWTDVNVGTGSSGPYETGKGDGKLFVNGTFEVDSFGGFVQSSTVDGAKLIIKTSDSVVSKELIDSAPKWNEINLSLNFAAGTPSGVGTYNWNGSSWIKQ